MVGTDLERIARTYGIRLLLQFGSTVTGHVHQKSDVDLAVLLDRAPLGLEEHAGLVHELQRLLPDRDVDLAVLNHADPLFLKKVTEQSRLLFGAPAELARLQLLAFKRYQDYRKYLDLERRFVARAVTGLPGRG
ncbi:MAG: type VII toxin-antitoxin system MntA family adenylyltransferase antitoxin [Candidatus Rokuibacteriota bacterium]